MFTLDIPCIGKKQLCDGMDESSCIKGIYYYSSKNLTYYYNHIDFEFQNSCKKPWLKKRGIIIY